MRGVSLEEIAAATRISTRFLEAIENEQWERLPGGAFNRGFIRSVARFLGLDEESMVAEYALETKEATAARGNAQQASAQGMPRDWRPAVAAIVGLLIVIIVGALAFHHYRARARARAEQQPQSWLTPEAPSPRRAYVADAQGAWVDGTARADTAAIGGAH